MNTEQTHIAHNISASAMFHAQAMTQFPKGSDLFKSHRKDVIENAKYLVAGLAQIAARA